MRLRGLAASSTRSVGVGLPLPRAGLPLGLVGLEVLLGGLAELDDGVDAAFGELLAAVQPEAADGAGEGVSAEDDGGSDPAEDESPSSTTQSGSKSMSSVPVSTPC